MKGQRPRPGQVARALDREIRALGDLGLVGKKEPRKRGVISTGNDAIDQASGVAGLVEGTVVIVHGGEATGKTTLALETIREVQQAGGVGVFFDFEQKLDLSYAESLGVNVDTLIRSDHSLKFIEQGFDRLERLCAVIRDHNRDVPVFFGWDSMQMASSSNESERGYDESGFNSESRSYSRCLRKFVGTLAHARAVLMLISQVRMDIGSPQQGAQRIGVGKACGHAATMILQWRTPTAAKGKVGKDGMAAAREGNNVEVVFKKNQVAPPFTVAKYPILYGRGACPAGSLLSAAEQVGLAEPGKGGFWHLQGPEGPIKVQQRALRTMADKEPEKFQALRAFVRAHFVPEAVKVVEAEVEAGPELEGDEAANG